MKKAVFSLTVMLATLIASVAVAADNEITIAALNTVSTIATVAGFGIAIAVFGPSLSQGLSIYGACTGIARNPDAAGTIRVTMIIGLALIESLAIYALVIILLLLFAFPYSEVITKFLG
ncbi:MAG: ATP synthase F0 subunit C [Deltaproteobacteria bacterium]|jgi:F-type H+-transporting ATPase subunit c|nr:ATP synthase F0 subunit C [Deltaproteobacteria bacterium]